MCEGQSQLRKIMFKFQMHRPIQVDASARAVRSFIAVLSADALCKMGRRYADSLAFVLATRPP